MKINKRSLLRLIIAAALLLLTGFLCIQYLIPLSSLLTTEAGRLQIIEKVESYGVFAPIVFTALMTLQIVIAFIPGGPLELIAGMLFGGIR
ncbi:MAG: hypothetical protein IJ265_09965, partial [Oscillospiraceae bacterium]|nr:hypothetical protein [Oscillospiraceae bacterium]